MTQSDDWIKTLGRKEQADEDRYFAEQDRKLIKKLQCQRQPAPAAKSHEPVADNPAGQASLESAEP